MFVGKTLKLKGTSQKGKNRIRENGSDWTVLAETDRVLFSQDNSGHWLFIAPKGFGQDHKASRWIRTTDDADFEMIVQDD